MFTGDTACRLVHNMTRIMIYIADCKNDYPMTILCSGKTVIVCYFVFALTVHEQNKLIEEYQFWMCAYLMVYELYCNNDTIT